MNVAIVYNDPYFDVPNPIGEEEAIIGVLEEVVAVRQALTELGHEVRQVPLRRPLEEARRIINDLKADLIFNLFEGFDDDPRTEPVIARWMFDKGIPVTGNPPQVLELTLDKARTKELLIQAGLNTPAFQVLGPDSLNYFKLNFPCVVKPKDEDASHGLTPDSVVHDMEQLKRQVTLVSNSFRGYALVEEFIDGREFNASVLGNKELSLVEISEIVYTLPPNLPRILTFESKWFEETEYFKGTGVACPAPIDDSLRARISNTVLTACRSVGCHGYARVDMRQGSDGEIYVLEVNANPDISPELGIARQANARGWTYAQLIEKIVALAINQPCR